MNLQIILILREVHGNDSVHILLFFLVPHFLKHIHEILDLPVVGQGELGEWQHGLIHLENVHIDRL